MKKDQNQRACRGCVTSIDIGAYDTCLHGCSYCYATRNSRQTQKNARLHDVHSPLIIGNLADHGRLTQKTLRPLLTTPKDETPTLF